MWNNAVSLNDREYKRLKLKAGELNSPYTYATTKSRINDHQTDMKEMDNNANMQSSSIYESKSRRQLDMTSQEVEFLTPVQRVEFLTPVFRCDSSSKEAKFWQYNDVRKLSFAYRT